MLPCLRVSSSSKKTTTNSQFSQSTVDVANTERSSNQTTHSFDLTREYSLAINTSAFYEIWTKIHYQLPEEPLQVEDVIRPSRECVEEALSRITPDTLTQLVVNYFNHSEQTTQSCLSLVQCIPRARRLYSPLHKLIDTFPVGFETDTNNSLSRAQCDWVLDAFHQFDRVDNPFPGPNSNGSIDMHRSFSQLKHYLGFQKSRSKLQQLLRRATKCGAVCLTRRVVFNSKMSKELLVHLAQLDEATKGNFVLHNHLETTDCLVARLHIYVEDYKRIVRFALDRGNDSYSIQEAILQLQKKHSNLLDQLIGLEEHLCLCFIAINQARSLLLTYFHLHI